MNSSEQFTFLEIEKAYTTLYVARHSQEVYPFCTTMAGSDKNNFLAEERKEELVYTKYVFSLRYGAVNKRLM